MKPDDLDLRAAAERERQARFACRLLCCASAGCQLPGAGIPTRDYFRQRVAEAGLSEAVRVVGCGCIGLCSQGPLVRVTAPGQPERLFTNLDASLAGHVVERYLLPALHGQQPDLTAFAGHVLGMDDPFFARQTRVVLRNNERLDPESLDDCLAHGGYRALRQVLTTMTPEQVIGEVKASGLRGRGGAGFPTGVKWELTAQVPSERRFVICNGDEGDPGAFMDRGVLEGDPHGVLEGMIIGAYAMRATHGIFYIRAEYPLAVERIEKALRAARSAGLLGADILGTGFTFDCQVRLGAGAFVCGEETALIASCEGKRGTPRPRPPFPSVKGIWNQPTCINNVETFANIPPIITGGAAAFASRGTAKSTGTKVFALTGDVRHNGLVEVPMGTTIRAIVQDIGGGAGQGRRVKAVQTGGPSGGLIPAELFDTPVSYEHLQQLGSIMGSGGMIVLDESKSIVDLVRFYLEFSVDESCGKCAPCRIGGRQLLTILDKLAAGNGTHEDLATARDLAQTMQKASLCGLGQTAPNPVLSAFRYFMSEFEARLAPATNDVSPQTPAS